MKPSIVLELVFLVDLLAMPVTTRGLGSERSRHELPARGVRIAPRGMRGDLLAGNGGGLADQPAGGAAHQIEVNVVIVIGIGARREHGGELLASRSEER